MICIAIHPDAEAHAQDALLARRQACDLGGGLTQIGLDRGIEWHDRVLVLDEIAQAAVLLLANRQVKADGSLAIPSTLRTLSSGIASFSASSSAVGSRPISCSICCDVRASCFIASIMCTGTRIVRAWSSIERVIACRIHQVA